MNGGKRRLKILTALVLVGASVGLFVHFLRDKELPQTTAPTVSIQNPEGNAIPFVILPPEGVAPSAEDFLNSIPKEETPKNVVLPPENTITHYDTSQKAPIIDHLSTTLFGNGDTITIYGKNFTKSNTIVLSIDFPDSFTDIQSITGTSLRFTADLALSKSLSDQFSQLSPKEHDAVVKHVISSMSAGKEYTDGVYVPATIKVRTDYGESNSIAVQVNITKGI